MATGLQLSHANVLQEAIKNGLQSFVLPSSLVATTAAGTPASGYFYSPITGRSAIADLSNDLRVSFGVERLHFRVAHEVFSETGPAKERVWAMPGEDRIRFIGEWSFTNDTARESRAKAPYATVSNPCYIEVAFYGTALNLLMSIDTANRAGIRCSVDQGAYSAELFPTGTPTNSTSTRNYAPNHILKVVSGLSLGFHTALIRLTSPQDIYGLEILNQAISSITVNPGTAFIDGLKVVSPGLSLSYNESVATSKGGRKLIYLKTDGTIESAFTQVDSTIRYLSNANHSNEELVKTYSPREFSGASNYDFASLVGTKANSIYTLSDGTTTLNVTGGQVINPGITNQVTVTTANASANVTTASTTNIPVGAFINGSGIPAGAYVVSITSPTVFVISANATASATVTASITYPAPNEGIGLSGLSNFISFTFVGTGIDLVNFKNSGSAMDTYAVTVDGIFVGNLPETSIPYCTTIASGLPYGTHVVKIVRSAASFGTTQSVTTTLNSTTVTTSSTTNISVGSSIVGTNIPTGAYVVSIQSATSFTISDNATAAATVSATFGAPCYISAFKVYQPKKPALPANAMELADYNVIAEYSGNLTAGDTAISNGVIRKMALREASYFGTWVVTATQSSSVSGYTLDTTTVNSSCTFHFWGTGVEVRLSQAEAQTASVSIDGFTNFNTIPNGSGGVGLSTQVYGGSGTNLSFTTATGLLMNNSVSKGAGLRLNGLPLGLHTITITKTVGTQNLSIEAFDVITPVHSIKFDSPYVPNTGKLVGSMSLSDNRNTSLIQRPSKKTTVAQSVDSASQTTSSLLYVPVIGAASVINSTGGWYRIHWTATCSASAAAASAFFRIMVNGQVSQPVPFINNEIADMQFTQAAANSPTPISIDKMVYLGPGTHFVQVQWRCQTSFTATCFSNILNVVEEG